MRLDDLLQLGFSNLWRTKLRTVLTTLGVTIGIGALVSMVSFGTGMQKNITDAFRKNDLFTSLQVTPQKININEALSGNIENAVLSTQADTPPLDDAVLEKIQMLPEVKIAYPEIRFPIKLRFKGQETQTSLEAHPVAMSAYPPFSDIPYGKYFDSDTSSAIILSQEVLKKLKIRIDDSDNPRKMSMQDSLQGFKTISGESLIGEKIDIVTSIIDIPAIMKNPFRHLTTGGTSQFKENVTQLRIGGILKKREEFENRWYLSDVIVPVKTAERIPRLGFSNVWNLLDKIKKPEGYASIYVRLKKMQDIETVRETIEEMGFGVFSVADQLEELKQGFIIIDTALGAVGTIALIVAALGIINTMVMSILERTREIGVIMAIGGSEKEIKGIFMVEASFIGWIGGILGLGLGWVVTRIANVVANYYIAKQGGSVVDLFYIPLWLILGALGFSILISLLAGLYPAIRAARVDPVEALRHD